MGKRGPAPEPTALKLVKGVKPSRINREEPIPAVGPVDPPERLSAGALGVWRRHAADLERMGILTPRDLDRFGQYCEAQATQERARAVLDEEGEVVDLPVFDRHGELSGYRRGKNPWHLVWREAGEAALRLGARFGLDPSSRSELKVGDGDKGNPADRLLSG